MHARKKITLMEMQRVTLKQRAEFFYLRVKLEFLGGIEPVTLDGIKVKALLVEALKSLHGQIGSCIVVDVLKYDADAMEAILRVQEKGLVKCWSALTLFSYYKNRQCAFRVIQVSPHLMSLAANSRQWKAKDATI